MKTSYTKVMDIRSDGKNWWVCDNCGAEGKYRDRIKHARNCGKDLGPMMMHMMESIVIEGVRYEY